MMKGFINLVLFLYISQSTALHSILTAHFAVIAINGILVLVFHLMLQI